MRRSTLPAPAGLLLLAVLTAAAATPAAAQKRTMSDIARSNLGLPQGDVEPGLERRVRVRDARGKSVVAEVHVEVGGHYVVLMPDGSLATVRKDGAPRTRFKFVPESKDEMVYRLKKSVGVGYGTVEKKHHFYIYDCSTEFLNQAIEIVEAVHQGVYDQFDEWNFDIRQPPVPLPVIIFRTQRQFREFGELPENINGYYDVLTNYIVLFEESALGPESANLAREEVLASVAHETVHQTLTNIGVQPRLAVWPSWISEGLAEYFSPTTDRDGLKWKGVGEVNDLRMSSLEQYFKHRRNPDGRVISRTVQSERLSSDGYAFSWALIHYLAKDRPATMTEYLRGLALRNPLELPKSSDGRGDWRRAELEKFYLYFGKNLAGMEAGMLQHLRRQPYKHPLANSPHYVAMIEYREGNRLHRLVSLTVLSEEVEKWKKETYSGLNANQRNTFRYSVATMPNRSAALQHAYQYVYEQR